ncbi:hypothetical protein [Salinifilum aidingensis]
MAKTDHPGIESAQAPERVADQLTVGVARSADHLPAVLGDDLADERLRVSRAPCNAAVVPDCPEVALGSLAVQA